MSSAREELLERVERALGRRAGDPVAPPPVIDDALVRTVAPDADVVAVFVERATEVAATVHRTNVAGVAHLLAERLRAHEARRVALDIDDAWRSAADDAVRSAGVEAVPAGFDARYDADVGIADAVAAIAESGTIVMMPSATRSRGAFLVPPVHIALVRAADIVPDLLDLWDRLEGAPAATVLVTGPSKTADIEGILVKGAHGPKALEIIVVG